MIGVTILLLTMVMMKLNREARQFQTLTLNKQVRLMEIKLQVEKKMGMMKNQKK